MSNADEAKWREARRRPPPEGPPWDLPLEEAPLAFVDLEMTGLDPDRDEIVEICVERVVGGRVVDRIESLVCPERATGKGMFVHGLDREALDKAPRFEELAGRVDALLEGAVFVAHGAEWDVRFLERAFARVGRERRIPSFVDTIHLTRRAFALESHALEKLRAHFGIETGPAHRAGSDVAAMRAVFERTTLALSAKTPRELWQVRVGVHAARPDVVAACEAAVASGVPVLVRYRPSRRAAEESTLVLTGIVRSESSAHVSGYHAEGRGRVELRAERILAVTPLPPADRSDR